MTLCFSMSRSVSAASNRSMTTMCWPSISPPMDIVSEELWYSGATTRWTSVES
nr:hypothetical protein [Actinomadura madurae]